jgi:hypothetical protein
MKVFGGTPRHFTIDKSWWLKGNTPYALNGDGDKDELKLEAVVWEVFLNDDTNPFPLIEGATELS